MARAVPEEPPRSPRLKTMPGRAPTVGRARLELRYVCRREGIVGGTWVFPVSVEHQFGRAAHVI